ncbi:MAG: DUF2207 domain-containing protein [Thermomicrobiales bacterium]|nr:DUF2207 domain-containing protein [Thermomicrobiales bacterium]
MRIIITSFAILSSLQIDTASADQTRDAIRLLLLVAGLAIVSFGSVLLLGLWYLRGRDPHTERLPGAGGKPPGDLPAAVVGSLIDERVDHHDLVATLFDLQRRGVVSITHTAPGQQNDTFQVTLLDAQALAHAFERPMLQALFGEAPQQGDQIILADRARNVATAYETIRRALYTDLVERGYFRKSPEATRGRWSGAGSIVLALGLIFFGVVYALFDWTAIFPSAALVGMGLALKVLSKHMPAKTRTGATEAARWKAFQTDLADIARMGDAAPALAAMERYLPYALALGVSSVFVNRFSGVLPVNEWATLVRDRVSDIDPSVPDADGLGDAIDLGASVLRHGPGDLSDLNPGSFDLPSIPSIGAPSMDTLSSASDVAGGGVQGASEFVMGLLNAAPNASESVEAAAKVAGAVPDILSSVDPGAVTGFLGSMADAAPGAIDAVGGILEVVDAAEILDAAGSVLGALLESLGDL